MARAYNGRMAEDYYRTLGLSRGASAEEIQKSYRELARKYHPDLNPDDKTAKEKFQKIQKAYEVLSDPKKRQMYEQFGSDFENAQAGPQWRSTGGGGGAGFQDVDLSDLFGGGGAGGGGFSDFFRQFTGGAAPGGGARSRATRQRPRRGADIEHRLEVAFRTAISGGEAQISVRRSNGKVETINVKIPPGIEDGKKIRLRGQGEPMQGGTPGDILITVKVAGHPNYQRTGNDLVVKVPVSLAEAALGATIDVPCPKGTISLKVPAGTSTGKRLRVKGCGVPAKSGTGDLLAEIQIVLPTDLDSESLELIKKIDKRTTTEPRATLVW
ncbi:MAG: J domain-containing protein [Planctomycetales bacterium]|nr:J domain-containing protein [Planctomycetales bacterium]